MSGSYGSLSLFQGNGVGRIALIKIVEMSQRASGKKVANSLVAISSAAVLAVYTAGYVRTRSAADQLEGQSERRRPPAPSAATIQLVSETRTAAAPAPDPIAPVKAPAAAAEKPVAAATPVETLAAPAPATPADPEPAVPAVAAVAAPAPVAPPAPVTPPPPPAPVWKDGTYTGWGTSRHGDIQASVIIEGGRIASATIAQCLTRYSCSVIDRLPPQVAQRQSPETDYVSGATQSTNAFYYAVVEALNKAK